MYESYKYNPDYSDIHLNTILDRWNYNFLFIAAISLISLYSIRLISRNIVKFKVKISLTTSFTAVNLITRSSYLILQYVTVFSENTEFQTRILFERLESIEKACPVVQFLINIINLKLFVYWYLFFLFKRKLHVCVNLNRWVINCIFNLVKMKLVPC